jgi:class 3 adenylate cyclase
MERDEAGTLERLKANRRAIFDPRVAENGGRIRYRIGVTAMLAKAEARPAAAPTQR